jgi:vancomycin resistance protein VanJ
VTRALSILGAGWASAVLLLSVANAVAPQRDGLLALSQILAPFLFLPLLVFLPLWRGHGPSGRALRVGLVASAIVFVVRFMPGSIAFPSAPTPGAFQLGVTTWNLDLGRADPDVVVAALRQAPAGIVALEELTDRHADPIAVDAELLARFPYRVLRRSGGSQGIGLLSSYPFVGDPVIGVDPPTILAELDLGDGRHATVMAAHPHPAIIIGMGMLPIPTGYDATRRDVDLGAVRARLAPSLASSGPVVLLGDLNVVDREPGYADLTAGMIDAQHAVGLGPGLTWRPEQVEWLPFGLLRIDMVLTAGAARPLSIALDCTPRGSDHCLLRAILGLP